MNGEITYPISAAGLSDDALIAEAASRGLSVMDAQEAARKQRIVEGIEALADECGDMLGVDGPSVAHRLRALLSADAGLAPEFDPDDPFPPSWSEPRVGPVSADAEGAK